MGRWIVCALLALAMLAACTGDLRTEIRVLAIVPPATMQPAGVTVHWQATALRYDGTLEDITAIAEWSTSDPRTAIVSAGRVTGQTQGLAAITVHHAGLSATAPVAVGVAVLAKIELAGAPALPIGVAYQLSLLGTYTDGAERELTSGVQWSSSNPAQVEVSAAGVVRGASHGAATITARVGDLTSSLDITISDATIATLAIMPSDQTTLAAGLDRQYIAIGTFTDGSTRNLTSQVAWASSDPLVAAISASGLVQATRRGTTTISATFGSGYGALALQVTPPVVERLAIESAQPVVPRGFSERLVAVGTFSDGSRRDLTMAVTWSSSAPTVASVGSTTGLLQGHVAGDAEITIALDGLSATVPARVTAATLASLGLAARSPAIPRGYGDDLVALGTFDDGTTEDVSRDVQWQSDAAAVTVAAPGRVTATATGRATITATRDGHQAAFALEVIDTALQTLAISPADPRLLVGGRLQLDVNGLFADGMTYPVGDDVRWFSNDSEIADVTSRGLVWAGTAGMTSLVVDDPRTAKFATATVTVARP